MALLVGSVLRGILEFSLPIDGLLLFSGVQSFAHSFGPACESPINIVPTFLHSAHTLGYDPPRDDRQASSHCTLAPIIALTPPLLQCMCADYENFVADAKGFAAADDWNTIYPEECSCIDQADGSACLAGTTCSAVVLGAATSAADCLAAGDGNTCKYLNKPEAFIGGTYYGPDSSLVDGVPYVGPTSVSSSLSGGDPEEAELPLAATDGTEMCPQVVRASFLSFRSFPSLPSCALSCGVDRLPCAAAVRLPM